jgi:hypothetical protein
MAAGALAKQAAKDKHDPCLDLHEGELVCWAGVEEGIIEPVTHGWLPRQTNACVIDMCH